MKHMKMMHKVLPAIIEDLMKVPMKKAGHMSIEIKGGAPEGSEEHESMEPAKEALDEGDLVKDAMPASLKELAEDEGGEMPEDESELDYEGKKKKEMPLEKKFFREKKSSLSKYI
jgi:hypothetical protein